MDFSEIFDSFVDHKNLKVISVASCSKDCRPNSAPKLLVEIVSPNKIFFLDYKFTQTYSNILKNPYLSLSFMDDADFTGDRLSGKAVVLGPGNEFEEAIKSWEKRLIVYETERMIARVKGQYSTKHSESSLPQNFVIIQLTAEEGAVVKPDR